MTADDDAEAGTEMRLTNEAKERAPAGKPAIGALLAFLLGLTAVVLGGGLLGGFLVPGEGSVPGPPRLEDDVPVTAMNEVLEPANNSPLLLADPTEPKFVVLANRLDAPDFSCALQVSGDSGGSWLPAQPVPSLPAGAEKCYAPEVAFGPDGRLHYLFVGLAGAGNEPMGVFLSTSDDRARSFSPPRLVLGPRNFAVRMAIDPSIGDEGRIHLVWLSATSDPPLGGFGLPPNPILAAHSDDGGETFSRPVEVSDADRQYVVAPALTLGADHSVHVAYYDLQDDVRDYQGLQGPVWEGTWSVVLSSSTDGGQRFSAGTVIDDAITPSERVMLIFTMPPPALVAKDEVVCAGWTDARYGDPDVLLRCSGDLGNTWQELRRLNDDPVGNGTRQYLPRLATSPEGRLDAVFFDRRLDPQNINNDVFYTYSSDGGQHFAPNLRLSRRSSNARIGQQYVGPAAEGQYEWGARLALLATPKGAVAAWPDTRHVVPPSTEQDLFATTVGFADDGERPVWLRLLGAAVLAAGAFSVAAVVSRWRHQDRRAALTQS